MRKGLVAFLAMLLGWAPARGADLTALETRWLHGGWPVIAFARASGLPLDIVVQPQPTPGLAPLALAFVDGRCKLVLSMRGNPDAEATLDRIAPDLLDATLELMVAHELGHCRRYLDGAWQALPSGFRPAGDIDRNPGGRGADDAAARREEGYGDLVGLAWTRRRHPADYARLQAWLAAERGADVVAGSPHDTLAWVELAADGARLDGDSIFAAAARLWRDGLAARP